MALTLLMPASSFAATAYKYTIVDQHCITGGHGHNPYFRVKLTSAASTPANKLTIKSKSQYYSAGKWHNFYKWPVDASTFAAGGSAHSIDYSYSHTDGSDTRQWRIVSVLKAYNGTQVLSHKTLKSMAC